MSFSDVGRMRIVVRGAVQGVGFRPFVYRLARELELSGWVENTAAGVEIEIEGRCESLERFVRRLYDEKPPRAVIRSHDALRLDPAGYGGFEIRESRDGMKSALILPDISVCDNCRRELFDPSDRRYLYPFINCTDCGPRYSIIEDLPYDRSRTTMKTFEMCASCRAEYDDPHSRRFHAQPNACPVCGPQAALWDEAGDVIAVKHRAIEQAAAALRQGLIVAVKGLGGFHLMADARSEDAVRRLRRRKLREAKPFAVMYPSIDMATEDCLVSQLEVKLLTAPEAPIVLLAKKAGISIAPAVAPDNPYLGVMTAYAPLHLVLMREFGGVTVATSGNRSDEPICIDEHEALRDLSGIADMFLVHDRPIRRRVDDSIVRVIAGRATVLRRARGYAPLSITVERPLPVIVAVGSHLKNTIAVSRGNDVFISQHLGDLENEKSFKAFEQTIADLLRMYDLTPEVVAHDAHPDYYSTRYAQAAGLPSLAVQHHYAHALACMAENRIEAPCLAVTWDGAGYHPDGTIRGGEFLLINDDGCELFASIKQFRLPGGDKAAREGRRSALALLHAYYGDKAWDHALVHGLDFTQSELTLLRQMLEKDINAPLTSSMGRWFDAIAALTGLRQVSRYEGEAAMQLEFALHEVYTDEAYGFRIERETIVPDLDAVANDILEGVAVSSISAKFHNMLVEVIVDQARRGGRENVLLTGGCFQNKYLSECAIERLRSEGFNPYWHQCVPCNDGGVALGQVIAAARVVRSDTNV